MCKQKYNLCDETPSDCHFELKTFSKGTTVHNDGSNINYLIYCQSGHARISSTLFHDEILCAGEIMFVPRQSECAEIALSDVTLFVHKFNNTVCKTENCILSYLYQGNRTKSLIPIITVLNEMTEDTSNSFFRQKNKRTYKKNSITRFFLTMFFCSSV